MAQPSRQRPLVTVYAEVSADGKSTHRRGASSKPMMALEDDEVRRYRHDLRARCGAIMVGANTARLDNPHLTVRHSAGQSPLRVVVTSRAELSPELHLIGDGNPTLIATTSAASPEARAALTRPNVDIVVLGDERVEFSLLLDHLWSRGVRSLMVEGGAYLLYSLFKERCVDQLIVQHLPAIFGGADTPSMVSGPALQAVDDAIQLKLVEVKKIGQHAVVVYDTGIHYG